jgi:hypothetical protein
MGITVVVTDLSIPFWGWAGIWNAGNHSRRLGQIVKDPFIGRPTLAARPVIFASRSAPAKTRLHAMAQAPGLVPTRLGSLWKTLHPDFTLKWILSFPATTDGHSLG